MSDNLRNPIRAAYLEPEQSAAQRLLDNLDLPAESRREIRSHTIALVEAVRSRDDPGVMQSFLAEYGLSTEEGVALMCLAEALLRVPDDETIDQLIQDKIVPHNWASHIGDSGSILVNASTWALMLSGRMLDDEGEGVVGAIRGIVKRMGEPVIRLAVERAMREMGEQFVLGQDIADATTNGNALVERGYTYSYDMLGEAAVTEADALRYLVAYGEAIDALAERAHSEDLRENPGISVKLSALHPRYEATQRQSMLPQMAERLLLLAQKAKAAGIGLNVDAEEADRLDLSLDVIEQVLQNPSLAGWDGFGIVVQAYGQRALPTIEWLNAMAHRLDRNIMIRLVKGAYWDTEIKRAQVMGLAGYPVYTRKCMTDVSYLACAQRLLELTDRIYPQFATHNAHTVAAVLTMSGEDRSRFEFQRLHGMGDALHDIVKVEAGTRCRIYAPVGTHEDLLAYLVRRLLENGANSSFVNQIVDLQISATDIAADPVEKVMALKVRSTAAIALPEALFLPERKNSAGRDLTDPLDLAKMEHTMSAFQVPYQWDFSHQAGGPDTAAYRVTNPADRKDAVGKVTLATSNDSAVAVTTAVDAVSGWAATAVEQRAGILRRAADLYEEHAAEFYALLIREAGKTRQDAIAELREAVDFLRYYAAGAAAVEGSTAARGCIICISPWNFPLAIFTGQLSAALVTGNTVIAKPAEQTPLVATRAVLLLHDAGVPAGVLQLVAGTGEAVGAPLVADPRIDGVCFTGSTAVARLINQQLAVSASAEAMFIAETGGLNAMIVDSTALLEQAVRDIVQSAFQSAGQRCSALRIVYVQEEIRDQLLTMLCGAIDALVVADPALIQTDVGPIIDQQAYAHIHDYCDQMQSRGQLLYQPDSAVAEGFIAPCVIAVEGIAVMDQEIFGPVLHLATFSADQTEQVIDQVNRSEYGLTFGLHTRIDQRVQHLLERARVGNFYVNRNQIGAVVGSQPFGGEGLSGTGPKAGGGHYLRRFRLALDRPVNSEIDVVSPKTVLLDDRDALADLLARASSDWVFSPDEQLQRLRKALRGRASQAVAAAAALDCGPIDLPGPTGESNQVAIQPLGTVICLSRNPSGLLDRVVQALRTGNQVIAVGAGADRALADLKAIPGLSVLSGDLPVEWLSVGEFAAVSTDDSYDIAKIRRLLSRRSGPILRLITERIYPAAYGVERAICIDTTAAGGNAALLAEVD